MKSFLAQRRVGKNKPFNMVSMRGGKFFIPEQDVDTLFDLHERESPAYTEHTARSLIWRWPNVERLPIVMDFDFRHEEEVEIPNEALVHFSKLVAEMVPETVETRDDELDFVIVRKQRGYWCNLKQGRVFKNGFHLYFPEAKATVQEALELRDACIQNVEEHFDFENTPEDVVDDCLPKRANGTIFLQDFKRGTNTGGRYTAVFHGSYGRTSGEHFGLELADGDEFVTPSTLCGWAFQASPEVAKPQKTKPEKATTEVTMTSEPIRINVERFWRDCVTSIGRVTATRRLDSSRSTETRS